MATRKPQKTDTSFDDCTEFQMHISNKMLTKTVLDFTEHRLARLVGRETDIVKKMSLEALLEDYVGGHVAVAFRRGEPTYIKVVRN